MKTAHEKQKERIRAIEAEADALVDACDVLYLASINEEGYPRICTVSKLQSRGFREIYVETSKRSPINGKATHFEYNPKASICCHVGSDSVTLIGEVELVSSEEKTIFTDLINRRFFPKGVDDPKHRLFRFHTLEATFWIKGHFRTCKYKRAVSLKPENNSARKR